MNCDGYLPQPEQDIRAKKGTGKKIILEIPRAKSSSEPARLEVVHQPYQAGLWLLFDHGSPFNGSHFFDGSGALLRGAQLADVMEDVDGAVNTEGLSTW